MEEVKILMRDLMKFNEVSRKNVTCDDDIKSDKKKKQQQSLTLFRQHIF